MLKRRFLQPLITVFLTAILGGLLGATLVRIAPGAGTSGEELNFQLSPESREFYRALHAGEQNVLSFYGYYLAALVKGDLGYSLLFQRPVRELLKERLPVTAAQIFFGVLVGWALGFLFAVPASLRSSTMYSSFSTLLSGLFLCIPSAVLALLFLVCRLPVKSPWLNPIEPRWLHGKRAIVEPERTLTADELMDRVHQHFRCEHLEPLRQHVL